jgi:hypothetical protein
LIPAQVEPTTILAATTSNLVATNEDPIVDDRVEEMEATIMEK